MSSSLFSWHATQVEKRESRLGHQYEIAGCLGTQSINHVLLETVRAGGWGSLLGDGGSGYAIGSALLKAVVNHHDGTGQLFAFHEHLPMSWQCTNDNLCEQVSPLACHRLCCRI